MLTKAISGMSGAQTVGLAETRAATPFWSRSIRYRRALYVIEYVLNCAVDVEMLL